MKGEHAMRIYLYDLGTHKRIFISLHSTSERNMYSINVNNSISKYTQASFPLEHTLMHI